MKKKNKLLKSMGFILFLALGAVVGYFVGKIGFGPSAGTPRFAFMPVGITLLVLLIPLFFVVIAVHEAGHALAGIRMKFDFRMYVVGPLLWKKEQNKWQFNWNKNVNTAGGLVICLPVGTENLRERFAVYAAGGPAASLLLAGIAYGLHHLLNGFAFGPSPLLQIISYTFLLLSLFSLIIFLATMIPMHSGGFSSDGMRMLRLLKGGDAARFEVLIIKIVSGSTSGIRPRLMNKEDLIEAQLLAEKLNNPFGVYLHAYLFQSAFDGGNMDLAEQHLLDYIQKADAVPAGMRNSVWLEAALFYALGKNDLNEASKYWDQFKPSTFISKAEVFAAEAAMSHLKNERETAFEKIKASIIELPNMMDKGMAIVLGEKLLVLKDKLEKEDQNLIAN
ncbi:M50 family metallopeptidase [Daejeonella oryzae]|uniref:M50 family metallopeptidase n=1 Tax=Daejeonella oryzae TaxID=1122943 RepID=UPI0004188C23|nr:M50 family metallopeptidase [Daejeonella oryzae]